MVVQPGAKEGDLTYCAVSGVVFPVKAKSPHREVDGKRIYFCCEGCASYFTEQRERVVAARGLSTPAAAAPQ